MAEAEQVIGARHGLRSVLERVAMVAPSDLPVLLFGETGTGKEVVARVIHDGSVRCDGPFLRVNCGALAPELVDSELFGHERGAFTGAIAQRRGWFEQAHRGTLFLDEVAELSPAVQVRLLRVLQEGELVRVGGAQTIAVDVRIVAATHRDLPTMVDAGEFRHDLFYRISAFPIVIPPLRERSGDIPELAKYFAARAARRFDLRPPPIEDRDVELLRDYAWPGNVRELASVIDRAVLLGEGRRIDIARSLHLTPRPAQPRMALGHAARSPPSLASHRFRGARGASSDAATHAPDASPDELTGQLDSAPRAPAQAARGSQAATITTTTATAAFTEHRASFAEHPAAFAEHPAVPYVDATTLAEPEPGTSSMVEPLDDVIRRHIEHALAVCHGRIDGPFGAAQKLVINPHTLRARMRKLGVDWRRHRKG